MYTAKLSEMAMERERERDIIVDFQNGDGNDK